MHKYQADPSMPRLRIAVIGAGIAGVSSSYYLGQQHDVTLFEARERLGGHTHTVVVDDPLSGETPVDTGFIVCNNRTYPHFHRFLHDLDVPIRNADMSFGFYDEPRDFGYAPTGLLGVFPRLGHCFNSSYWRMWLTLPGFNRQALRDIEEGTVTGLTLREYVELRGISTDFVQMFLVPMGAAIWSSADELLLETPAETFLAFFKNHGLLSLFDRPQWQTVIGGSHQYLKAFRQEFTGQLRIGEPVRGVSRNSNGVTVRTETHAEEHFDVVVLACHADQVLPILQDASPQETALFEPWKYHLNDTVLHTDRSYLPPDRRIWASWNYRRERGEDGSEPLSVTYHMNRLQGLETQEEYCVTLNPRREIAEGKTLRRMQYSHPMYTVESVKTQQEILGLNGCGRTFFCGSYLGWGFHEDAIRSSQTVIQRLTSSGLGETLQRWKEDAANRTVQSEVVNERTVSF